MISVDRLGSHTLQCDGRTRSNRLLKNENGNWTTVHHLADKVVP